MILAILKALHLFAAFAWMAGLWYYPRLLVYQCELQDSADYAQQEKRILPIMSMRLMRYILMPSMTFTLFFGFWLAIQGDYFSVAWIHGKILCVAVLIVFSVYLARLGKKMRAGIFPLNAKQLRLLNEVPTIILIAILFFVVVYPML